jgi:hypothetical protein
VRRNGYNEEDDVEIEVKAKAEYEALAEMWAERCPEPVGCE